MSKHHPNSERLQTVLVALGLAAAHCIGTVHAQTVVEYIHTDALGSPVARTNASGVVIEQSVYEPYGEELLHGPTDVPGFAGHVSDSPTKLSYMQQRYYDPAIGRFLSVDPVTANPTNGTNFNRYKYAANNPYRFTDPDGRYECAAGKANCERLEKATNLIAKAAEKAPADSRVAQVNSFLGKPGEKNGVVISGNLAKPTNLGEATRVGNEIHIGLNFKALSSTDRLGSVTMHEGSHGVDQRDDAKAEQILVVMSRSALNATELTASAAQAQMFQNLGRAEPMGLYSPTTGVNWDAINSQADTSVNQVCKTASGCNP